MDELGIEPKTLSNMLILELRAPIGDGGGGDANDTLYQLSYTPDDGSSRWRFHARWGVSAGGAGSWRCRGWRRGLRLKFGRALMEDQAGGIDMNSDEQATATDIDFVK